MGFPCSSVGKESASSSGDPGSIPGLGRSPGERNGNPLQYLCLENLMNRGVWWAAAHGITKVGHDWVTNTYPRGGPSQLRPPSGSLHSQNGVSHAIPPLLSVRTHKALHGHWAQPFTFSEGTSVVFAAHITSLCLRGLGPHGEPACPPNLLLWARTLPPHSQLHNGPP